MTAMSSTTILFGVVLTLLGLGRYFLTGATAAHRVGELIGVHVIPYPADGLEKVFPIQ